MSKSSKPAKARSVGTLMQRVPIAKRTYLVASVFEVNVSCGQRVRSEHRCRWIGAVQLLLQRAQGALLRITSEEIVFFKTCFLKGSAITKKAGVDGVEIAAEAHEGDVFVAVFNEVLGHAPGAHCVVYRNRIERRVGDGAVEDYHGRLAEESTRQARLAKPCGNCNQTVDMALQHVFGFFKLCVRVLV